MRGGAENQLLEVVKQQVAQGIEVEVAFLKGEPELASDIEHAGGRVNKSLSNRSLLTQFFLLRKLLLNQTSIIHAHLPRAEIMCAFTIRKSRFFFTRHNSEPFFPIAPHFVSILLSRFVCHRSVAGIAITNAVREYGISSKEIGASFPFSVVHYGYTSRAEFVHDEKRQANNENNGEFCLEIVTIGRLVPQKDQRILIASLAELLRSGNSAHLTVIGDGILRAELEANAINLGVATDVTFLGRIENPLEVLYKFDVFVLPSVYEGFGLVLLEAMDCGLPIIGADNTSIPEVLGPAGMLFKTGNSADLTSKLLHLYRQDARNHLSKLSKLRLMDFSPTRMSEALLKIYRTEA
jgi:glycosyltransferase involved in cell wall biosynthesis